MWIQPHSALIIDGKSSLDFDMYLSGGGTYSSPEKAHDEIEVPGRNGSVILLDGNYKNVTVSYEAFIFRNVKENFRNLRSFLLSRNGYVTIEDSYHPDEFRYGTFLEALEPTMSQDLKVAQFTLDFNCRPERFLKSGGLLFEVPETEFTVLNPTYFNAFPLVRINGKKKGFGGAFGIRRADGKLTQFSVLQNVAPLDELFIDVNCELQEAFHGEMTENRNLKIELTEGKFPYFSPGENHVLFSGDISSVYITPRFYML